MVMVFFLLTGVSWLSLLVILPVAQAFGSMCLPTWPDRIWRTGIVACAGTWAGMVAGMVHWALAPFACALVLWSLMRRWFDMDAYALVVTAILSWTLQALVFLLAAAWFFRRTSPDAGAVD